MSGQHPTRPRESFACRYHRYGFVGPVSEVCLSKFGHNVTCMDNDVRKAAALKRGIMPVYAALEGDLPAGMEGRTPSS
ncbi:MAG TPA: hypothetical protein VK779_01730 [Rhizomicrobium sp.]|nr:hypothetical protein [Rhizomicrobium sp.]